MGSITENLSISRKLAELTFKKCTYGERLCRLSDVGFEGDRDRGSKCGNSVGRGFIERGQY